MDNVMLECKDKGNVAFKEKKFEQAEAAYSSGIDVWRDGMDSSTVCTLLTNRSNARFMLRKYEASIEDARKALQIDKEWDKAYFRLGLGLMALDRVDDAIAAYKEAVQHAKDKAFFQPLLRKLELKKARRNTKLPSLYPDQPDVPKTEEDVHKKKVEQIRQKLSELGGGSGGGDQDALFNGLFSRLLKPESFRQIVYHSKEIPEGMASYMPASFQELVNNEHYYNALVALFPRIKAKAESVLENVKAKAAKEGQFMDAATEAMLKPQVLNEAFAHQVVDMIHDINRKQNAVLAEEESLIASPDAEEATLDQLNEACIDGLKDNDKGFGIMDEFMEEDAWQELLREDVIDMIENGVLIPKDVASGAKRDWLAPTVENAPPGYKGIYSGWVPLKDIHDKYDALTELITKLRALPHELNRKIGDGLNLRKVIAETVLITVLGPIKGVEEADANKKVEYLGYGPRFDGSFGRDNNGYKISAVYHFNPDWDPSHQGELVLGDQQIVEPKPDRLVLYRSRTIQNQVRNLVQQPGATTPPRFSLSMYFNGPSDETTKQW